MTRLYSNRRSFRATATRTLLLSLLLCNVANAFGFRPSKLSSYSTLIADRPTVASPPSQQASTSPHHPNLPFHRNMIALTASGTTNSPNNAEKQISKTRQSNFLIISLLYPLACVGLVYRAYTHATNLPDSVMYLSNAALCLFNLSHADRKRCVAASKAKSMNLGMGTISTPEEIDEAERGRYAAQCYASALTVKTFGQLLGILRMIRDRDPYGGAAVFMATQIAYFIFGGGRYRHTDDDGTLDPIEERLVVGASTTYGIFTLAALVAGRVAAGSVARGVGVGIYCLGCMTGAFDGVMSLMFGGRRVMKKEASENTV